MLSPKDPGGQHVGFLLNSLGVTVALTSDTTAKNLPKDDSKDHIVQFKGEERGGGEEEGRKGGEGGRGGERRKGGREGRREGGTGKVSETLPMVASGLVVHTYVPAGSCLEGRVQRASLLW